MPALMVRQGGGIVSSERGVFRKGAPLFRKIGSTETGGDHVTALVIVTEGRPNAGVWQQGMTAGETAFMRKLERCRIPPLN